MHKAVCSECGKDCEVPFKPTGDKPVFCSDCFRGKKNVEPRRSSGKDSRRFNSGDRRSSGKDSRRFNSGDRRMYKAVCDECGKECEVPFEPTSKKPIYCSECFSKGGKDKSSGQGNKQFEAINVKLDKILEALSLSIPVEKDKKPVEKDKKKETAKKTKTSKPKPKK